jgi:hypothetical protein
MKFQIRSKHQIYLLQSLKRKQKNIEYSLQKSTTIYLFEKLFEQVIKRYPPQKTKRKSQ